VNLNRRDAVSTLAEGLSPTQAKKLSKTHGERRREGGLLSPPTLARRAAWRVISIQETRCHWMMRSGFSPSDEDEAGGARECHG